MSEFIKNPLYGVKGKSSVPNEEALYFRYSGKNLFYTSCETDTAVLGAIAVKKIVPINDFYLRKNCFEVYGVKEKWMLCGCNENKENWIEIISSPKIISLNLTINETSKNNTNEENKINASNLPDPVPITSNFKYFNLRIGHSNNKSCETTDPFDSSSKCGLQPGLGLHFAWFGLAMSLP